MRNTPHEHVAPGRGVPGDGASPPGGPRGTARAGRSDRRSRRFPGWLYVAVVMCVAATVGSVLEVRSLASASTAAYHEEYRPQVHFSPAKDWMNDPNGLIYYKGQYHLFFQYNAKGNVPGNISWGHAVSSDLVHWKELPVAIPETSDEMVFSGSVVFDKSNTSGLGTAGNPPLVAVYTSAYKKTEKQAQSLAYSTDDGATWKRYSGDPVLNLDTTSFRDPKVFWYEPAKTWMMVVALPSQHKASFYSSADLKTWKHLSDFGPAGASGGEWECPDLFPMSVDGDPSKTTWVLVININPGGLNGGSATQYFTGDFDGKTFTADGSSSGDTVRWADFGSDFYASATYNDVPGNKRIMIAWMSNWLYGKKVPTSPWRGADTFPRELSLTTIGGKPELVAQPIDALTGLRSGSEVATLTDTTVKSQTTPVPGGGDVLEIQADLHQNDAKQFGINVRTGKGQLTKIGYDTSAHELYIDRTKSGAASFDPAFAKTHRAPLALDKGQLKLHIIVDTSSVEVFADQGEVTLTDEIFPDPSSTGLSVFAEGGSAQVASLHAWKLASIW